MTTAITLSCITAWLLLGYAGGRGLARRAYYAHRRAYPSLAMGNPKEGKSEAVFVLCVSTLGGPVAVVVALTLLLVRAFAHRGITRLIPELRAAEAAAEEEAHRKRLAELQQQIDAAHSELGIAPLARDHRTSA